MSDVARTMNGNKNLGKFFKELVRMCKHVEEERRKVLYMQKRILSSAKIEYVY